MPNEDNNLIQSATRLAVIRNTTLEILPQIPADKLSDPEYVESAVLNAVRIQFEMENSVRDKSDRWRNPTELLPAQIADILAYSYPIASIAGAGMSTDSSQDIIAVYQTDGPDEGVYIADEVALRRLIRSYNYNITIRGVNEVVGALQEKLPRKIACRQPNLVAVNNGIFDYDKKELHPFSPDYVFLSKSKVNYNPDAVNVNIHNDDDDTDWDVESWMSELTDDPEVTQTLWEILGAIVRPLVAWDKSAWLYSESGNNGKGTLCELMRQLCGEGSYASIPLSDFSKDFALEPLIRSTAIIVDENDVGTYIDKAANLKAIITNDVIQINRKFKTPIAYKFYGFMVQCLNEMPRIKDKSDSFFRRQLFIPFTKCFTGRERKYIKHDYLHREEVLEYVLFKVLNMDYYELSTPDACREVLEEYKTFVNPVRAFMFEILPRVKWDLLPNAFLYEMYIGWYRVNNGSEHNVVGSATFLKEVKNIIQECPAWEITTKAPVRTGDRISGPEPLIMEYGVKSWMNAKYLNTHDETRICTPTSLSLTYRGIYRITRQVGSDEDVMLSQAEKKDA